MLSGPSFRLAFIFNINLLILSGFRLTSFHLVKALLSAFPWIYTLVCAVVQKFVKMFFIYIYSHFQYSFCNQPVLFAQPYSSTTIKNINVSQMINKNELFGHITHYQLLNEYILSNIIICQEQLKTIQQTGKKKNGLPKWSLHYMSLKVL